MIESIELNYDLRECVYEYQKQLESVFSHTDFALLLQTMPMSAFASLADELYEEYIAEPNATEFVSDSEEEPAEEC